MFFMVRKNFLKNIIRQCPCYLDQKQQKSGSRKLQIVNSCLTSGSVTSWSVQLLQPHDLHRMETNKMGQKELQQQKHNLGPLRIPAAGSKIILFLFKNNNFCAAGENCTS